MQLQKHVRFSIRWPLTRVTKCPYKKKPCGNTSANIERAVKTFYDAFRTVCFVHYWPTEMTRIIHRIYSRKSVVSVNEIPARPWTDFNMLGVIYFFRDICNYVSSPKIPRGKVQNVIAWLVSWNREMCDAIRGSGHQSFRFYLVLFTDFDFVLNTFQAA